MSDMILRFAPSPTGHLHVGGARTALFNFLYARANGGQFKLRIEDTDKGRSTKEYLDSILEAMRWLGLDWDGDLVFQGEREERHREVVQKLLETGHAYRCYCTADELKEMRETAMKEKRATMYDGRWRDHEGPFPDRPFSVRFRSPNDGETVVEDRIQGRVVVQNKDVDDLIIARSDGTPTYNLAVVVDDSDMGITDVVRGDDHLNNTFKQVLMYQALDLEVPGFAHVPMILGADKARLSKRHGATSVVAYREQGYLPEALRNYLVRLGWSHGDQEIFSLEEMIEHFDLAQVGKSASVFNPEKLDWLNAEYMRKLPTTRLAEELVPRLAARGYKAEAGPWLEKVIATVIERAQTLEQMVDSARVYFLETIEYDEKAVKKFLKPEVTELFEDLVRDLGSVEPFEAEAIEGVYKGILERRDVKLKHLAQPTRIALTGGTVSPGIYDLVELIGRETVLERLRAAIDLIAGMEPEAGARA